MSINAKVHSYLTKDYHTESFGTAIDEEVPGSNGKRLALVGVDYWCNTTLQRLCIMHCGSSTGSRNTTSAAALSGQKVIATTNAPLSPAGAAIAASDILAFQLTDGSWEFDTCASVSSSNITCTNNITGTDAGAGGTAIASGGAVRIFGIISDGANFVIGLKASTHINYTDAVICQAPFKGDPLYVSNANGTAASLQYGLLFAYIDK